LTEEEFWNEVMSMVFERDIRIYDFYGIKMEDFIYGWLLYES